MKKYLEMINLWKKLKIMKINFLKTDEKILNMDGYIIIFALNYFFIFIKFFYELKIYINLKIKN